ncbi:MAG: hypothetical protein NZ480_06810 [Bdellovibrionaceae bacterium]|nr:hypothetical protein [Pseudobdellovibrionaceae bacterium]MDW8190199.1 hypothetical protein [Pseudobdellovibrionaceae bacterium]
MNIGTFLKGYHDTLIIKALLIHWLFFYGVTIQAQKERIVTDPRDAERLSHYYEFQNQKQLFEQQRKSALAQFLTQRKKRNLEREKMRMATIDQKKRLRAEEVAEKKRAFQQWLQELQDRNIRYQNAKQEFIMNKQKLRLSPKKVIAPSEEEELNILEKTTRVDWEKRRWSAQDMASGISSSGSTPPPSSRPNFPPPYDSPGSEDFIIQPPDFFDLEIPPPPDLFEPDTINLPPPDLPPQQEMMPPPSDLPPPPPAVGF